MATYPRAELDQNRCGARQVFLHRSDDPLAVRRQEGDPCTREAGHEHDVHAAHVELDDGTVILAFTWPWTPDSFSPGGTQTPMSE